MKFSHDYRKDRHIVEAFGGRDKLIEVGTLAADHQAAPCPFCGGEAVLGLAQLLGAPSLHIECSKCHVATVWTGEGWDYLDAKQFTIVDAFHRSLQRWNKRQAAV